jgi:hypothetical protein
MCCQCVLRKLQICGANVLLMCCQCVLRKLQICVANVFQVRLVHASITLEFSKSNSDFRDPKRFSVNLQPIRLKMMMIVPGSVAG